VCLRKNFRDCEVLHSVWLRAAADYLADGTSLVPEQPSELKKLKISGYPIMAGTIVCALQTATGPPASALDRWVELTNNTRMIIVEIYLSHVRTERWNIDLLGDDFLAPASSVLVNISDGAGCRFDFKTVFDDGTTQLRRNVDVCAVERYAISYR
jgi:hypothetical protein